jgi:ubiquinone/menaquinone biosynthesis C-methylase UbiE
VDQAEQFLAADGIPLVGKEMLDIGSGDGIISLGLLRRAGAARVTGVDLVAIDWQSLFDAAERNGVAPPRPEESLDFAVSDGEVIPLPSDSVDVVTAWSVFEHVSDPVRLLVEIHRVLRAGGALFIQIWPMWNSEHGSHLWPWFDQSWVQLRLSESEILQQLRQRVPDPELASSMMGLYRSCNRITVDDLQAALLESRFYVAKVELTGSTFHVPAELQRVPLSQLGVEGIKLLAVAR